MRNRVLQHSTSPPGAKRQHLELESCRSDNSESTETPEGAASTAEDTPMQGATCEREDDIAQYAQHRQHNARNLAAHLPLDVLTQIFLLVRDTASLHPAPAATARYDNDTPRPQPSYAWLPVTHVCRHWRQTALEFPQLWSVVPLINQEACIRAMLERAQRVPLTIAPAPGPRAGSSSSRVVAVLREHARIITFDVRTYYPVIPELDTAARRFPLLETLALEYLGSDAREHSGALLRYFSTCDLPRLRRLDVDNGLGAWPTSLLTPTLTHLCLRDACMVDISAARVVDALEAMPLLEELTLQQLFFRIVDLQWPEAGVRVVRLPHLRKLKLQDGTLHCADLLRRLSFPADADMSVTCTGMFDSEPLRQAWTVLREQVAERRPVRSLVLSQPDALGTFELAGWRDAHPLAHTHQAEGHSTQIPAPHLYVCVENNTVPAAAPTPLHLLDGADFSCVESLYLDLSEGHVDDVPPSRIADALVGRFPELRELGLGAWGACYLRCILMCRVGVPADAGKPEQGTQTQLQPTRMGMPRLSLLQLDAMRLGARNSEVWAAVPLQGLLAALKKRKEEGAGLGTLVIREAQNFYRADVAGLEALVGTLEWDGVEKEYVEDDDDDDYGEGEEEDVDVDDYGDEMDDGGIYGDEMDGYDYFEDGLFDGMHGPFDIHGLIRHMQSGRR